MAESSHGRMRPTDIIKEAWGVFAKKFNMLWLLALLTALPSILQALFTDQSKFDKRRSDVEVSSWDSFSSYFEGVTGLSIGEALIGAVIFLTLYTIYQVFLEGALVKNVMDMLRHNTAITWQSIKSAGKTYFKPLFWASVAVVAIVIVGAVFFILPGIIAAFLLAFTPYFVVDHHLGTKEAMKRSYHLAKDNAGEVLVLALLIFAIVIGSTIVVQALISPLPDKLSGVVEAAYSAVIGIFGTIAFTRLYLSLTGRTTHPPEADN